MALDKAQKAQIIEKFGASDKDTGSPKVQIALLSQRIDYLTDHLKINKKDHASKIGLLRLVGQRKRLLRYLKKKNIASYGEILKELNLRDRV